jgi:cysteine synthase
MRTAPARRVSVARTMPLRLPDPVVERHGDVWVVRDDLIPGGSKSRFLPYIIQGAREVVYGAPFCGGAPVALAYVGATLGIAVTIFYAKRRVPHPRQRRVRQMGARIVWVPMGFMSHVQQKARLYAEQNRALFLPLGFDVSAAEKPFVTSMKTVRDALRFDPDEVWCATSSGMLARCLSEAFPSSRIKAVTVGLKSRHEQQAFASNVELVPTRYAFAQESRVSAPFPICPNYEAKAWELCVQRRNVRALFWNVIGR